MASTMKVCSENNYWIKMPEIISNFASLVAFTQRSIIVYLNEVEEQKHGCSN
jgi:hypothetical protein